MVKETYVPLVRLVMVKEKELPYRTQEINTPENAAELARQILDGADREHLLVISGDNRGNPLAVEIAAIGSVNGAAVTPREIFKHAVLVNATYIILAHNHTSGNCTPSRDDKILTKRIAEAGDLMGIPLEDHIIIGNEYFSFRREGLL